MRFDPSVVEKLSDGNLGIIGGTSHSDDSNWDVKSEDGYTTMSKGDDIIVIDT